MENNKSLLIADRTFSFALQMVQIYQKMVMDKEYVISKQLLRCSTSIGANVHEAGAAQSKADFITKMYIASKEARETLFWLRLIQASKVSSQDLTQALNEINSIVNILSKIVKSSQENLKKEKEKPKTQNPTPNTQNSKPTTHEVH